ncbi:HEAT repeat domain-containing protein [Candidatus Micrarchaeota archaeon]|nr:HEAT repeat domain-containing protein [Candidatus Micrarchaeota archaeon]
MAVKQEGKEKEVNPEKKPDFGKKPEPEHIKTQLRENTLKEATKKSDIPSVVPAPTKALNGSGKNVDTLLELLSHDDPIVREEAVKALKKIAKKHPKGIGEKALKALEKALNSPLVDDKKTNTK